MSTIHDNSKSKKINKTLEMNNVQLEKLHTGRRYFYFYYDFLEVMTKLEAMFLQDLINRATLPATKREVENDDVYFQCTMTFLQCPKFATWTENEQRAHLASLTSKGFIKTMRRGGKATRWVHIDYVAIHRAINEVVEEKENADNEVEENQSRGFQRDSENQSRGFQRDESRGFQRLKKVSTNVDTLNKKRNSRRSADDGVKSLFIGELSEGFLSEEKDSSRQADEKRAARLRKAMKEIFYDSTDLTHRCNFIPHADDYKHIEKIRHDPKYTNIDIDALIDDYIEIMGQPFVPETHTVKKFRDKLPDIIAAINRKGHRSEAVIDNGKTYTGE